MKICSCLNKGVMIAVAVVCSAGLQSCLDDNDKYYYVEGFPNALVTVKNATDGSFFLQLNDSTTLLPTNMSSSPFGDKEVRALVNYDEVSESGGRYDKAVQVNWIDSILTKSIAPDLGSENDVVYGTDPVEIVNDWVTIAEDGYLTLRFRTKWGDYNKVAPYPFVTVQITETPVHIGDRVQDKAVAVLRHAERHGGQEVHEALIKAATFSLPVLPLYQGYVFGRYAPFEKPVPEFITAGHIGEADGEIFLLVDVVVQLAAVKGRCIGRYATFHQIFLQSLIPQGQDLHVLKGRFGSLFPEGGSIRLHHRHTGTFRYEPCLCEKITAVDKLSGKIEDVTAYAQPEIVPDILFHIHTEGRCPFAPVRCRIPQFVSASSCRFMSQPSEKVRNRYLPHFSYIHTRPNL